ncbi:MAG: Rid family detoxifying hydrolase [Acidobacteriota bacterium]
MSTASDRLSLEAIATEEAPAALGPYAQAVRVGDFVYTSGQVGIDPGSGQLVEGFEAQARQVMRNLAHVLEAADASFADVVKATIYVVDLGRFALLNQIYAEALGGHRPARSTVEVAALPAGAEVEIDLVVHRPR